MNDPVDRVISALRQYPLLKYELNWYRDNEPEVYAALRESIRVALQPKDDNSGDNRRP